MTNRLELLFNCFNHWEQHYVWKNQLWIINFNYCKFLRRNANKEIKLVASNSSVFLTHTLGSGWKKKLDTFCGNHIKATLDCWCQHIHKQRNERSQPSSWEYLFRFPHPVFLCQREGQWLRSCLDTGRNVTSLTWCDWSRGCLSRAECLWVGATSSHSPSSVGFIRPSYIHLVC